MDALDHGDSRGSFGCLETSTTSKSLRKQVLPVLEDMPHDEAVCRGNVILKTRPRDVEETLLQLINDDDPAARPLPSTWFVRPRSGVLPTTSSTYSRIATSKIAQVFEAASWALAEQRMPAERRRGSGSSHCQPAELAGRVRRLPPSLRRSASTSCSGSQARRARSVTRPAASSPRKDPCPRAFTYCSMAGDRVEPRLGPKAPRSTRPRRWRFTRRWRAWRCR